MGLELDSEEGKNWKDEGQEGDSGREAEASGSRTCWQGRHWGRSVRSPGPESQETRNWCGSRLGLRSDLSFFLWSGLPLYKKMIK